MVELAEDSPGPSGRAIFWFSQSSLHQCLAPLRMSMLSIADAFLLSLNKVLPPRPQHLYLRYHCIFVGVCNSTGTSVQWAPLPNGFRPRAGEFDSFDLLISVSICVCVYVWLVSLSLSLSVCVCVRIRVCVCVYICVCVWLCLLFVCCQHVFDLVCVCVFVSA